MDEFMIKKEDFCLRRIEKVPKPKEEECFLLYQEGTKKGMVISHGGKYSATEIRHKHYNMKATFQLQRKYFMRNFRVIMKNYKLYFNADITITYELQDVQEYFWENLMEDDALLNITKKCVDRQNRKWQAEQEWELRNSLEINIMQELKQFKGVKFQVTVESQMDEAAQKILDSDRDTMVGIHTSNNRKNVQIATNKHMAEIVESEKELKMKQIEQIKMLMKNFGVLASVANEYLEGKIGGKDFFNYIMKARTDELNLLNMAVTNDLLTGDEVMKKINKILTNSQFEKIDGQQLPGDNRDELNPPVDEREGVKKVEDTNEDTCVDGDYL